MARILIADDDADYLLAFCDGMIAMGHEARGVGTGAEVIPLLMAERFDIVFLDVVMEGGGAITLVHAVREYDAEIPLVVITGRSELMQSPLFLHGLRQAQAKVQKTATLSELDHLVRSLLPQTTEDARRS